MFGKTVWIIFIGFVLILGNDQFWEVEKYDYKLFADKAMQLFVKDLSKSIGQTNKFLNFVVNLLMAGSNSALNANVTIIYRDNFLEALRNDIEIRQCDNFRVERCYNFMPIRIFVVRYVVPAIVYSKILAPKEYPSIPNEIENSASADLLIKVQSIDVESETAALHECYLDSGKSDYAGCEKKALQRFRTSHKEATQSLVSIFQKNFASNEEYFKRELNKLMANLIKSSKTIVEWTIQHCQDYAKVYDECLYEALLPY